MNGREVSDDEIGRPIGDVEIDTLGAQALHLVVDGAGDDVSGGQLGAGIETGHEALAVGQQQARPLATQRLRDQKRPCLRVIEAGRVKLHEFHVGHTASGAPGHGDAVTGGDVRIAGVEIDLVGAAGGDDDEARQEGFDPSSPSIEHVGTETAVALACAQTGTGTQMPRGDEIHRDMLLVEAHIGTGADPRLQGGGDGPAGCVRGVHHPPMAMTSLAGEVIAARGAIFLAAREGYPLVQQPADIVGAVLHHAAHHTGIAESGPGPQGVLDVGVQRILGVEDGRDAPLGVQGAPFGQLPLGDHRHREVGAQSQGQAEARCAAAEDQDVVSVDGLGHGSDRTPKKRTAPGWIWRCADSRGTGLRVGSWPDPGCLTSLSQQLPISWLGSRFAGLFGAARPHFANSKNFPKMELSMASEPGAGPFQAVARV